MKKYEQDLKRIIELSDGGCEPVHQEMTEMTEAQLRFLAAKGFLSLEAAGDNKFWVVVEPAGLAYFSDKGEAKEAFIKEHLASFLSGFFSGVLVTVVAAWIIQTVL